MPLPRQATEPPFVLHGAEHRWIEDSDGGAGYTSRSAIAIRRSLKASSARVVQLRAVERARAADVPKNDSIIELSTADARPAHRAEQARRWRRRCPKAHDVYCDRLGQRVHHGLAPGRLSTASGPSPERRPQARCAGAQQWTSPRSAVSRRPARRRNTTLPSRVGCLVMSVSQSRSGA